jgi:hypothetical protein
MKKVLLLIMVASMMMFGATLKNGLQKLAKSENSSTVIKTNGYEHRLSVSTNKDGQKVVIDTVIAAFIDDPSTFAFGIGAEGFRNPADTASVHVELLSSGRLLAIGASWGATGTGTWNVWEEKNIGATSSYLVPMTGTGLLLFPVPWTITTADVADDVPTGNFQWLELEGQGLGVDIDGTGFAMGHSMDASGLPRMWMDEGGHNFVPANGPAHERAKTWLAGQATPDWFYWGNAGAGVYTEYVTAAVVQYSAVPPVVDDVTVITDYLSTNPSPASVVSATVTDLDGTIASAMLYYSVNEGEPVGVAMSADGDTYTASLPGGFAAGDAVSYWVSATDNDAQTSESGQISFSVVAAPTTESILLFADSDGTRTTFFVDALDALSQEGEGFSYFVWDVDVHGGFDATLLDHGFAGIIHEGWGANYSTPPNQTEASVISDAIDAGSAYMLADMDYFFHWDIDGEFTEGTFAYDYLGVASATSDPALHADAMTLNIVPETGFHSHMGVDQVEMDFASVALDGANWSDYVLANANATDIISTDSAAAAGEHSGIRNEVAGVTTMLLPTQIEAADSVHFVNMLRYFVIESVTSIEDGDQGVVANDFQLKNNFPNPFNPTTTIEFYAPKAEKVVIEVFNSIGQKVKTLYNATAAAGNNTVEWNATDEFNNAVASGVYYYQAKVAGKVYSNKMILIK